MKNTKEFSTWIAKLEEAANNQVGNDTEHLGPKISFKDIAADKLHLSFHGQED